MKKKLILSNSLLVVFIIFLRTVFSCLFSWNVNKENQETSIRIELNTISQLYQNEASEKEQALAINDTIAIIEDSDEELRITFIDQNGNVLADTISDSASESHLQRPEIQNVGTIFYRYSSTLKEKMRYIACQVNQGNGDLIFIRIARPSGFVFSALKHRLIVSLALMAIEILLVILINRGLINHTLKPLKSQLNRLSNLGGKKEIYQVTSFDSLDINEISSQIDYAEHVIKEKINNLKEEQKKLAFIINTRHQGLLVLNFNEEVVLINSEAKDIFQYHATPYPKLTDVTINPDIIQTIRKTRNTQISDHRDLTREGHYYHITTDFLETDWSDSIKGRAVAVSIFDRTDEKQLADTKRDFFANASHELKSPLTTIIGFSDRIKKGFLSSKEEIDNALSRIIFESKRRNNIVRQMLDLSRLETETMEEDISKLSIKDEVIACMREFDSQRNQRNLKSKVLGNDFDVLRKKEDCQERIKNLIENAVRYNRPGGSISVAMDDKKKSVCISDTGIGIPSDQIPRIFERFYRVDKAHSRKLGGTGLGLSIVKHICLNYKIRILVHSELNKGSSFTLFFPQS